MKKVLLLLLLIILPMPIFAIKITKNEVDKFDGIHVLETSFEKIYEKSKHGFYVSRLECALRKVEDSNVLMAAILVGNMYKFDEDSGLIILFSDGSKLRLYTNWTGISSRFMMSQMYLFETNFDLDQDAYEQLKNKEIESIRVVYYGGHEDTDLKKDKKDKICKIINYAEEYWNE